MNDGLIMRGVCKIQTLQQLNFIFILFSLHFHNHYKLFSQNVTKQHVFPTKKTLKTIDR